MDKAPYEVAVQVWNELYTPVRRKTPTDVSLEQQKRYYKDTMNKLLRPLGWTIDELTDAILDKADREYEAEEAARRSGEFGKKKKKHKRS